MKNIILQYYIRRTTKPVIFYRAENRLETFIANIQFCFFLFSLSLSLSLFRWTNVSKAYLTIIEIRSTNLSLQSIGLLLIINNKYIFLRTRFRTRRAIFDMHDAKEERWRNGYARELSQRFTNDRGVFTVLRFPYCLQLSMYRVLL